VIDDICAQGKFVGEQRGVKIKIYEKTFYLEE
jgi:hypothetical protein